MHDDLLTLIDPYLQTSTLTSESSAKHFDLFGHSHISHEDDISDAICYLFLPSNELSIPFNHFFQDRQALALYVFKIFFEVMSNRDVY